LLFAHDNTAYAAKGPGNENATGRIAPMFFAGMEPAGRNTKTAGQNPAVAVND
jgi:hypothetical protein